MVDANTGLPTSENYGIDAQYNLIDIATNKSVMTGTTFSRVSYDIPGSYPALRPRPRLPRCRGSRRPGNRGKHPDPAGVVLRRRHLTTSGILETRSPRPSLEVDWSTRINYALRHGSREDARRNYEWICSMVALRGKEIDAFLARPDPGRPDHPALWSRCRPGARARRCAAGVRGRRSQRSVLAGEAGWRRAFRRAVAAGRRGPDDPAVRRPPRDPRPRRLPQFCQRRRYAGGGAAERLPHRDRGRRAAPGVAAAQGLRARQDRGRDRLLSRHRARSCETDRR